MDLIDSEILMTERVKFWNIFKDIGSFKMFPRL